MSVQFLDELPLVRVENFYLRLTDVPLYQTGFSNASLVNLTNANGTNAIIPGPVGTLPLDEFIYYIIGALVIIFCILGIWDIFKAVIRPQRFYKETRTSASPDLTPPYRAKRPPPPARLNTILRDQLGRRRREPKYQSNGYADPSPLVKPNLPLPVVIEVPAGNSDDESALQDIGEWEKLVKEKAKLDNTITNLQRIAQAQKQAGEGGMINPRLQAALQKRARVQNSINATYERFNARRGEWSAEEWQVVESIMEYSQRSTV